jgi:3-dehydrosphinganine reductase
MEKEFWKDKVVIITGGSSGIGFSIAKELAQAQANLYLIARDQTKLDNAVSLLKKSFGAALSIHSVASDVSDSQAITLAINDIGIREGKIDLLVNNAGVLRCGRFEEISLLDVEHSVQVNFMGAVYCCKAAWKYLSVAHGRIAFVSSVAGYIGLIGYSAYAPTKFAMAGLAECLRMEGKRDGISISIIFPGDTQTPMLEYEYEIALPETLEINKAVKAKHPDEVAKILLRGVQSGKFEIYCDIESRAYRIFKNFLPRMFYKIMDGMAERGARYIR